MINFIASRLKTKNTNSAHLCISYKIWTYIRIHDFNNGLSHRIVSHCKCWCYYTYSRFSTLKSKYYINNTRDIKEYSIQIYQKYSIQECVMLNLNPSGYPHDFHRTSYIFIVTMRFKQDTSGIKFPILLK